jgi:hypothetical protein
MFQTERLLEEMLNEVHQHGAAGGEQLSLMLRELQQINLNTQQMNGRLHRIERWIMAHDPQYPQLPPDGPESEALVKNGVAPIPLTTDDRRTA